MDNILKQYKINIYNERLSNFTNSNGVWQDGTTPVCRDKNGKLWAISGHSHVGNIAMYSGTSMSDLKHQYVIKTDFEVGKAGVAFNNIKYPEGIESRGSIWPFGLYICPVTNRFFVFFHNETGWAGKGTAYDATGLCDTPYLDSDFRHIGLMHSDDEGRNWKFDRWVLSSEAVCFSEKYNPNNDITIGQKYPNICLGSGDFSIYIEEKGDFIYLFYNMLFINMDKPLVDRIDVYVARCRKRYDGVMGDFVKYYNGKFQESGIFGKETAIVKNSWHPKVVKLNDLGIYMMSSSKKANNNTSSDRLIDHQIQLRVSKDLIHWSKPLNIKKDNKSFGDHYCAFYAFDDKDCYEINGNKFVLQLNGNGTDVIQYDVELVK